MRLRHGNGFRRLSHFGDGRLFGALCFHSCLLRYGRFGCQLNEGLVLRRRFLSSNQIVSLFRDRQRLSVCELVGRGFLSSQIVGWLLIALNSPRLPSHTGAVLLLLTPVGAVLLGAWVLGERPTLAQWAGCALILVSAYATVAGRRTQAGATVRAGPPVEARDGGVGESP